MALPWQWTVPYAGIMTETLPLIVSRIIIIIIEEEEEEEEEEHGCTKIFRLSDFFVKISLPVRSLRKTECVESLSAGKQYTHSETRREGFSLQKKLLQWRK